MLIITNNKKEKLNFYIWNKNLKNSISNNFNLDK